MQKKDSFCFLLGCFIRLSPKSCSLTETEIYRNRKFDPETEISASESDFRFRLCSTPNVLGLAYHQAKAVSGDNIILICYQ